MRRYATCPAPQPSSRRQGGPTVACSWTRFISTVREARRRRSWPSRRTLLLTTISSYAMAPNLMQVHYDNGRSFAAIGLVAAQPMIMVPAGAIPHARWRSTSHGLVRSDRTLSERSSADFYS
jgi:hypothetical protein